MPNIAGSFNRGQRLGGGQGQALLSVVSLIMQQQLQRERFAETQKQNEFTRNLATQRETRMNEIFEFQKEQSVLATERREDPTGALQAQTTQRQITAAEAKREATAPARKAESLRSREASTLSTNFRNLYNEAEAFKDKSEQFPSIGPSGIAILSRTNWNDRKKGQIKSLAKQRVLGGFDLRAAGFDVDVIGPFLNKDEFTRAFRKVEGLNPTPQEIDQLRGIYWE